MDAAAIANEVLTDYIDAADLEDWADETFDTAKGRREWLTEVVEQVAGERLAENDDDDESDLDAMIAEVTKLLAAQVDRIGELNRQAVREFY